MVTQLFNQLLETEENQNATENEINKNVSHGLQINEVHFSFTHFTD